MKWRWVVAALVCVGLFPRAARAHDFRPGALTLIEKAPGTFAINYVSPVDSTGTPAAIEIAYPDPCREDAGRLVCGDAGLGGEIAFTGLSERMRIVVLVTWLGGERAEWIVSAGQSRVAISGKARTSALAWVRIGAEHILFGLDHLAFVLALLLLLGAKLDRRLLSTLTAFTLAHSLTLALAVLDLVALPSGPVEAAIAASVVLVAREATHDEPTATRRAPWAVALLFGLVHGLGFAGALADLGLPEGSIGWALFWFNVGVELGQLAIVIAAIASWRALHRFAPRSRGKLKLAACYGLGSVAAFWLIARLVTAWR